jgi:hypothetical protein
MLVGLLLTALLASVCWVIAGRRLRSQPLWLVLGVLFGPIALVALALLPSRKVQSTESLHSSAPPQL